MGMEEGKQTIEKETLPHALSTTICDLTKPAFTTKNRLKQKTKYSKEQGNI